MGRLAGGSAEVRDREIAGENPRYVDKDGAYTIARAGGHESRMNGTERERTQLGLIYARGKRNEAAARAQA